MQTENASANRRRFFSILFFSLLVTLLVTSSALGQQPFVTDDADVTPRHHFHFEFSNEIDWLQRDSFPNLKQNTLDFELDYGVFHGVEVGFQVPVLTIINDRASTTRRVSGVGDANISLKYNFLEERKESRWPALTVAMNLELPTGDTKRQLGSGLADFFVNGIIQKTVTDRTRLRLNGGVLFSGNDTTGVLGIKSRGTVFTGGGSLVRQMTPKLNLGVEIAGAVTRNFNLGKGQLQGLLGGNYAVRDNMSFDFGIVLGKFSASPRVGIQLGISIDF